MPAKYEKGSKYYWEGDSQMRFYENRRTKKQTDKGESRDPAAKRTATVTGPCAGMKVVTGAEYVKAADDKSVKLELPAGEIVVLSFEKK